MENQKKTAFAGTVFTMKNQYEKIQVSINNFLNYLLENKQIEVKDAKIVFDILKKVNSPILAKYTSKKDNKENILIKTETFTSKKDGKKFIKFDEYVKEETSPLDDNGYINLNEEKFSL